MVYLDEQPLFDSGPTTLEPQGLELNHDTQAARHGDGVTLHTHGRSARQLRQHGWLLADSRSHLLQQIHTIEHYFDGIAHTLHDTDAGRHWDQVVMTRLHIDPFVQIGARWKANYRIDYMQPQPQESAS